MKDERPPWAGKVRTWLTTTQYEHLNEAANAAYDGAHAVLGVVESCAAKGMECLEKAGLAAVCLVYGHMPVADGIDPDDDRCEYCEKVMPHSAHGPQH